MPGHDQHGSLKTSVAKRQFKWQSSAISKASLLSALRRRIARRHHVLRDTLRENLEEHRRARAASHAFLELIPRTTGPTSILRRPLDFHAIRRTWPNHAEDFLNAKPRKRKRMLTDTRASSRRHDALLHLRVRRRLAVGVRPEFPRGQPKSRFQAVACEAPRGAQACLLACGSSGQFAPPKVSGKRAPTVGAKDVVDLRAR